MVIAVDRDISNLKKNGQLRPYELDITDCTALKQLYCDVLSKYGRIDVVVNNAGLFERILLFSLSVSVTFNFPPPLSRSITLIYCPLPSFLFCILFLFRY